MKDRSRTALLCCLLVITGIVGVCYSVRSDRVFDGICAGFMLGTGLLGLYLLSTIHD